MGEWGKEASFHHLNIGDGSILDGTHQTLRLLRLLPTRPIECVKNHGRELDSYQTEV
jgi:hypothetical protein